MSSSSPPSCSNCFRSYATDNLPRTTKCSHTYCQKCLRILIQCPIDQAPIDNTLPISSYPINMAVAKSITRTQNHNTNSSSISSASSSQNPVYSSTAYFSQNSSYQLKTPTTSTQYQSIPPSPRSSPASQFPPYFSNHYVALVTPPAGSQCQQPIKPPTPPVYSISTSHTLPPKPTKVHFDEDHYTNNHSHTLQNSHHSDCNTHLHQHVASHSQINPEKQRQKQICVLHNKEIDLICIDDGIAICSNCALFGDHKLHNIKTIENSLTECTEVAEKTMNVLTEIKKLQSDVNPKSVEDKIDTACREKKLKLSGEIKAYYQKMLSKIIAAEKQSYLELERMLEDQKRGLKQELASANKEKKRAQWIEEASSLIKQTTNVNTDNKDVEKICKFLDRGNKQDSFLKQGQYILVELNSFAKLSEQKISNSFNDIIITKQNPELQRMIKEGCKVFRGSQEAAQSKWVSPQKDDDDLLLNSLAASQLTKRVHTFSVDTHNEFNEMIFQQFQQRLNTETSNQKQSYQKEKKETDQQRIKSEKEKQPFGNYNGQARKKKKIKVPEKYQQAVEDLRNDRAEIIDFTNADLGDVGMMPIFDLLRGTVRVKTLKLIRNKLTDECLSKLLECCLECKITTINLSQNSLTDHALEILENAEYRELRSITLNQNRINQRNARPRIQELKRIGLTVLV